MKLGLFPGQGIPARVVAATLPDDDPVVHQASEMLGYDLRKRVDAAARRERSVLPTAVAQPAIFTASVVAGRAQDLDGYGALLGHSLGEYAALVAGGAMTFEDALGVVQVRADAMQLIAARAHGGMVALIELSLEECEAIAAATGTTIANDNAPGQVVVAGTDDAIAAAAEEARTRGGRAVRLEVTAAFHTSAIAGAGPALREALDHVSIRQPALPVISNVTAQPYRAPGEIRKLLIEQLSARVRFRESLQTAWDAGHRDVVDLGPGRVVSGLATRTFAGLDSAVAV